MSAVFSEVARIDSGTLAGYIPWQKLLVYNESGDPVNVQAFDGGGWHNIAAIDVDQHVFFDWGVQDGSRIGFNAYPVVVTFIR